MALFCIQGGFSAFWGSFHALLGQPATDQPSSKTVLFLGNSITAGFGLDPDEAFPALIEKKARQSGFAVKVINAGLSGETTAGGKRRISWLLRQPIDILVIELGGNDGLRGTPVKTTEENLQSIIDSARVRFPEIQLILAGMKVPPNLGKTYSSEFEAIYPRLAKTNRIELIPFILEGVGGNPQLNLPDGIHPTSEGHKRIAELVWKYILPHLKSDNSKAIKRLPTQR